MPPPCKSYSQAFALNDNPFSPTKRLENVPLDNAPLMTALVSQPLRIHKERALLELYCREAGPYGQLLQHFKNELNLEGFDDNPPSVGNFSYIFLIRGPQGTGKTSLANVMIDYVKRCTPAGEAPWQVYDEWPNHEFNDANEQIGMLQSLKAKIINDAPARSCILVDNLIKGAETATFQIWDQLRSQRMVFFFLVTSDLDLIKQPLDNSKFDIKDFSTRALLPDEAVAFVRHRLHYYRPKAPSSLANHPLFPFDEYDIREKVAPKAALNAATIDNSMITLRQFGQTLNKALRGRMMILDSDYDVAKSLPNAIEKQIIALQSVV
jgi:hypothetical protein